MLIRNAWNYFFNTFTLLINVTSTPTFAKPIQKYPRTKGAEHWNICRIRIRNFNSKKGAEHRNITSSIPFQTRIKYKSTVVKKLTMPCKPVKMVCVRYVSFAEIPVNWDTTQNHASFVCERIIAPLPAAITNNVICIGVTKSSVASTIFSG